MDNNFRFNPVFNNLKPSSTLFINEQVNRLWARGEKVFHMGFGESRFNVLEDLKISLATHSDQKSYLPARGLPELTEAVANYYSVKLSQEFSSQQVIVGPGSKAIIYGLQMVLGADVFLPTPSWVSYAPQATILGNRYSYIDSSAENDYRLEISELDKLVRSSSNDSKLLIINTPNNPTGQMMTDGELQALASYCRDNKIIVLSDEIYFQITHADNTHVSISKYYPEGTIICGGLSKHFSIGGWRLGVGILPDTEFGQKLMEIMVTLASETWSGVSSPIQYAAITAYSLAENIEQYVDDCRSIHGVRTRFCHRALSQLGVRCSRADGAFYIAANFSEYAEGLGRKGINTSSKLAVYLLEEHKLATLPGSDFGLAAEDLTLRLSTSYLDMESSQDSQRIFDLYKSGVDDQEFMSKLHHPMTNAAMFAFKDFLESL